MRGLGDDGKRASSAWTLNVRPLGPWGRVWEGGARRAWGRLAGFNPRGPFLGPFSDQKNIKKTIPQKIVVGGTFCVFLAFFDKSLSILGRFWDPNGLIFDDFRVSNFGIIFWTFFDKKCKHSKSENIAPDL